MQFLQVHQDHLLRRRVETCINSVYSDQYGANLTDFPELLVALIDDNGEPICAAGVRFSTEGFFSERYLAHPINQLLDQVWASPVGRQQIGEITSLAGMKPGASLLLIKHIVDLLRRRSVTWAIFTATERLRAILRRSGVSVLDIGKASVDCVDDPAQWGGYYDTNPRVVAVHDSMLSIVPPADILPVSRVGVAVGA
ncbi:MAG: thermostable hemolysin [Rhodospirillales bacterium]|nr:thermostable hemolysin [Rhodospirillales bacterium]